MNLNDVAVTLWEFNICINVDFHVVYTVHICSDLKHTSLFLH